MDSEKKPYFTITEIVGSVYCEQKVVFDKTLGRRTVPSVQAKALHGTIAHKQFELEGRTRQAVDSRCYIASCVYGADALETVALRLWRDEDLLLRWYGKVIVGLYYRLSPIAVWWVRRSPRLLALSRRWLDRFVETRCGIVDRVAPHE